MYQVLWEKFESFTLTPFLAIICMVMFLSLPQNADAAIQEYNLSGHTALIRSIDISSDGRYLVSGGEDRIAKVWDLSNGSIFRDLTSYTEIDNKQRTHTIQGHKKEILSTAFSQDSKLIVTGDYDGHIKIWSTDTGKITFSIDSSSGCFAEKFSYDGKYLADAGVFDNITFWDTNKGDYNGRTSGITKMPFQIAFSNDNKLVAAGNDFGKVQLWTNKDGDRHELRTLSQNNKWNYVNELAFSPDNKWIVAGSGNYPDKAGNNLKLWEVDTGRLVWSVVGDSDGIGSVSFSPDGKTIATFGQSLKIWDISGNLLKEIPLKSTSTSKYRGIQKVRIINDGKIIACRSDGNNIKVWVINAE
ncbi:WD40 repeat domain-containing protein [Propionispora vibrioides]|uniref:WD40 repeat n=1 Tax=Propionispora vibrioides TaxID=112903 RepID=A0A1H8XLT8_9FIRM|nr:WD40 repeat domain-containing protein [Propionispora vibrioides]SEP41044.1 WD40 repeat [Propionispora vibrioides]